MRWISQYKKIRINVEKISSRKNSWVGAFLYIKESAPSLLLQSVESKKTLEMLRNRLVSKEDEK